MGRNGTRSELLALVLSKIDANFRSLSLQTRFQKDGLLGVLKVITGSAILALLRIIYTVRHIYKKDEEDKDATASVFSAMKTTLWIFPKR